MEFTLIVTEKPSAALMVANALSEGKAEKINKRGAAYYRIQRKGKNIVVAPAVGHLFVLTEKNASHVWTYPTFTVEWKETFSHKNNYWAKKYFQNLKELSAHAKEFISATDYDVEGSVIAYNILRFIAGVKDGRRMKFSTLTKPDLIEAYEKASPHLDFAQVEAGLTRHYLDFFWGINTSRALTLSLREAGAFKILSTGRVQGPTLKILDERQKEIDAFIPTPFWEIHLDGLVKGEKIIAYHITDKFWKKEEAQQVVKRTKNKQAVVEAVEKKRHTQYPPFPFDLTTLQRESYTHFGYSPKMTLDIAQSLYGRAYISYPRTSSQKLSAKIGYKNIMNNLWKQKKYQPLCDRLLKKPLKPNEGKKTDPAHPSIFPTGNAPRKLNRYEEKVYDLIVKRFLSVFADPAIRESDNVTIDINGEKFLAQGIRTIQSNWIDFYQPYATFKEQTLPPMSKGDIITVNDILLVDKETQPPKKYTQATILKEMERLGLGTKATRAHILDTLYEREYIKESSIEVTDLGESVVAALKKYCADIISVEMTRNFETQMELVHQGKKKKEEVIKEAESRLNTVLTAFKKNEKNIGQLLLKGYTEVLKEDTTIGTCTCGANLITRMSRAKKRFVGCSGYPKCTQTFSLPQHGYLTILKDTCEKCGLHIVLIKPKGKRPWKLCIRDGYVTKRKPKVPKTSKTTPKTAKKTQKAKKSPPRKPGSGNASISI